MRSISEKQVRALLDCLEPEIFPVSGAEEPVPGDELASLELAEIIDAEGQTVAYCKPGVAHGLAKVIELGLCAAARRTGHPERNHHWHLDESAFRI